MKGDDFLGCCDKNNKGCGGGCEGHCNEDVLNAVTELEIYYSEPEGVAEPVYIFDSLYSVTNTQLRQSKCIGLEGKRYESLGELTSEIIERLNEASETGCDSYGKADIVYIRNN